MKLIFLGPQGSGKSTQAKVLAADLSVPYIEMGQLLRDKSKEDSEQGQQIREDLEKGNLVPNEITIGTLKKRLEEPDCQKGYVLDGYPRNEKQLEGLPEGIQRVFYVKVTDEEATARLMLRGREDDSEEVINRRLELYHNETEPLIEHFKSQGILEEVDGQRTVEEIEEDLKNRIKNIEKNESENK